MLTQGNIKNKGSKLLLVTFECQEDGQKLDYLYNFIKKIRHITATNKLCKNRPDVCDFVMWSIRASVSLLRAFTIYWEYYQTVLVFSTGKESDMPDCFAKFTTITNMQRHEVMLSLAVFFHLEKRSTTLMLTLFTAVHSHINTTTHIYIYIYI